MFLSYLSESEIDHVHNISNAFLLMSDIFFTYDRISPAESTILGQDSTLFLKWREESSLRSRYTSIEHVPEGNTGELIYFLMWASEMMMILEVLMFGQFYFDNSLLFKL